MDWLEYSTIEDNLGSIFAIVVVGIVLLALSSKGGRSFGKILGIGAVILIAAMIVGIAFSGRLDEAGRSLATIFPWF